MQTFVIAGGASGIGLQAARELLGHGGRVILLGRDPAKGEAALASFGEARERAEFLSVDLSTHAGVRDAAARVGALAERIDGLMHSAAVFETKDVRTADGLPLFLALGYLSRYHLTQLLLPQLLAAEHPRVIMMGATLASTPKIDPTLKPYIERFDFLRQVIPLNGTCLYYAAHLARAHPRLFAGFVSPGFVLTGLFRTAPWYIKAYVALRRGSAISVQQGASNAVRALREAEGPAFVWNRPGDFEAGFAIEASLADQEALVEASRALTGV